ncbi:helix-turn-helix domain-containing protein [Kitasatospora sp. NPDC051914]|uniref:winged helix-turn-helix transcriptional regulator n=1 Tax=Kitasatospora sp. NPDC051914 TaxID=3154945 RepID=UPI00342CB21D
MATPQTPAPTAEPAASCAAAGEEFDIFAAVCPSRDVFAELADKWSLLLVLSLHSCGEQRFSELQRSVGGVSRKMLTQSLRALERDGLVLRTVHPETPPRVVYGLLPLGRTLAERIAPLGDWVESYAGAVVAARERFDAAHCAGGTPGP